MPHCRRSSSCEVPRAEINPTPVATIVRVGRHFDRIRDLLRETGHAHTAIVVEHPATASPHEAFGYGERRISRRSCRGGEM